MSRVAGYSPSSYNPRAQQQQQSQQPRGGVVQRPTPRLDMEYQRQVMDNHRRQLHEKWVAGHQGQLRFDHHSSRVRADLIVNEARRLEREHLQHQLIHARALVKAAKKQQQRGLGNRSISATDATPGPKLAPRHTNTTARGSIGKQHHDASSPCASPHRDSGASPDPMMNVPRCACLTAPVCRQITPKYRALALLKQTFEHDKVEEALETLRETYASDHDMLEDLVYRYGPEAEEVSPNTRLRCVEEKVAECDDKWREIGRQVMDEMKYRDAFPNVIRNLSIMRIFLEGSQAATYGCDTTERSRRDAFHQQVLDQLAMERSLFLTPQRGQHH